jgi:hypothetical protein
MTTSLKGKYDYGCKKKDLFTSEPVIEGHPNKLAVCHS